MTARQEIELRRSEIRQRLGEIAALATEQRTAEIEGEQRTLMDELRGTEPRLQAAIAAEEGDERLRGEQRTLDGETAEYRGLCERSRLSAFFHEARTQSPLGGETAEAELRAAVLGANARPALVPWEMLLPRGPRPLGREEQRADASTDVTVNAGAMQDTILGRVFADTMTAYLGARLVQVDRGVSAHPVISDGATGEMKAKGAAVDADAATVGVESLEPKRLTARYRWRVEDAARVDMLEDALRADLSGAMGEAMDAQVVAGDGAAPNVQGVLTAVAAPDDPGAATPLAGLLSLAAAAVDGRYAVNAQDVRTLVGPDLYAHLAATLTNSGDIAVSDYLMRNAQGFRTSVHMPTLASNVGNVLSWRTRGMGSAVAPLWAGFEMQIRDDVTAASTGEVILTAVALWNFKVLRAAAYHRSKVKTS